MPNAFKLLSKNPFNSWYTWDTILPICMRNIWLTENDNLFNHKDNSIPVERTIADATEYGLLTQTSTSTTKPTNIIYLKWKHPNQGSYKLNTDGSVKSQPGPDRIGGVFRDDKGD